MATPQKKPPQKTKTSARKAGGKQGAGLPGVRDFLTHPEWAQDVYWSVIRKALLAIAAGAGGMVIGYYRLRQGDAVGAGLCWVGLSLVGSWMLKPTEAEFEFLGRYNQFVLHPPEITTVEAADAATALGVRASLDARVVNKH